MFIPFGHRFLGDHNPCPQEDNALDPQCSPFRYDLLIKLGIKVNI